MDYLVIAIMICGNADSYALYDKKNDLYQTNVTIEQIMQKIHDPASATYIEIKPAIKLVCA